MNPLPLNVTLSILSPTIHWNSISLYVGCGISSLLCTSLFYIVHVWAYFCSLQFVPFIFALNTIFILIISDSHLRQWFRASTACKICLPGAQFTRFSTHLPSLFQSYLTGFVLQSLTKLSYQVSEKSKTEIMNVKICWRFSDNPLHGTTPISWINSCWRFVCAVVSHVQQYSTFPILKVFRHDLHNEQCLHNIFI